MIAETMAEFLIDHGISPADVIVEGHSTDTHENAVEVARILQQRGIRRVVVVSAAKHLPRAERCFRSQGYESRHQAATI